MQPPHFNPLKGIILLVLLIFCCTDLVQAQNPIIPGLPDTICANRTDTILFYRDPAFPFNITNSGPPIGTITTENEITSVSSFPVNAVITINNAPNNEIYGLVTSLIPPGTGSISVNMQYLSTENTGQGTAIIGSGQANHFIIIDTIPIDISLPNGVSSDFCEGDAAVQLIGFPSSGGVKFFSGPGTSNTGTFSPILAGVGNHIVSYQYTIKNCTEVASMILRVHAKPSTSLALPNGVSSTFCVGAPSVQLQGTPSGGGIGIYTGSGTSNSGVFTPSTAGVGTHTINYSYTNNNNCTEDSDLTLSVVNTPSVSITPPSSTSFCSDAPAIQLQGSPSGGVFTGGGGVSGSGGFDPSLTSTGLHTIYYHYNNGSCGGTDSITLVVFPAPTASIALPNGVSSTFCINDPSVQLQGTPTSGGNGSFIGNGINLNTGTFSPSLAGVGTHVIIYEFTTTSGCTARDSINLTVTSGGIVSITPPSAALCSNGAPITLQATPSGGTFSGAGISGSGVFDPSSFGAGIYKVYYTSGGGCSGIDSLTLGVSSSPTTSINIGTSKICLNAPSIQLQGSPVTGGTGVFTGPGASGGGNTGMFDPSVAGIGSHIVMYSFTDNNGCSASSSAGISVDPVSPPVFSGYQANYLTTDLPTVLNSGNSPTGTFNFSGSNVTFSAGSYFFDPSLTGIGNKTIYYSYTNSNGCTTTDSVTVVVSITASISPNYQIEINGNWIDLNSATVAVCPNTDYNIRIEPYTAPTYPYTAHLTATTSGVEFDNGGIPVTTSCGTAPTNSLTNAIVAVVRFTQTANQSINISQDAGGCTASASPASYNFSPTPVGVSMPLDQNVCVNSPAIAATATCNHCNITNNISYTHDLFVDGVQVGALAQTGTTAPYNINHTIGSSSFLTTGTVLVEIQTTRTDGSPGAALPTCVENRSTIYTVVSNPTASISVPSSRPDTLCTNNTITQLIGTPSGGFFSGSGTNSTGIFDASSAGAGMHLVYYNLTTSGCNSSDSVAITVLSAPSASIALPTGTSNIFCSDDSAVVLIGTPTGGTGTYYGPGTSPTTGTFRPQLSGVGSIYSYYEVTGINGCIATDSINLIVNQTPVPAFSGFQPTYLISDPPSVLVSANSPTGAASFSGPNVTFSAGSYSFDPSLTGPGAKTIYYSFTSSSGCSTTDSAFVTVNGNSSGTSNPISFINNDPGAPNLMEACIGSDVSFNYDNFTTHPDVAQISSTTPGLFINIPVTPSNITTGTISGVKGSIRFTIPANTATGPIVFSAGGTPLDTTDQSLVIHNPPVDFIAQRDPICATDTRITLFGFPSGGIFTSVSPNILVGNILDPSQIGWPPANNVDSLGARIAYNYTPTYSNGTACLQPIDVIKTLTVYDNRLNTVSFSTLTQQNAAAGNQVLSLDAGVSNMVVSTVPNILCNSNPANLLVPCFPHTFSGTFVDQNNNFLSPIAGGRNLVRLQYNNNGCIGNAAGFIDILGALVIFNLPDTMCRASDAIFERDPSLVFLDTSLTANNGTIRRTIINKLVNTYTSNPAHQQTISVISATPGQEIFEFDPSPFPALPANTTQVEVNMDYLSLTTNTSALGLIDTLLIDTFTIQRTVNIISGINNTPLSVGNLQSTYCANEVGDTLFPSLGFLGPNSNTLYLLSNRVGGGFDTTYLVDNFLNPGVIYNNLLPAGTTSLTFSLAYDVSYYGCPDALAPASRPTVTIRAPLYPSFTSSQSSYCQGDAPVVLQRPALPIGVVESFSGSGIIPGTDRFAPNIAAPTQNNILYTLTDTTFNCSYSYQDSILVTPGPIVELRLDGSTTLDKFCYDNNNVVITHTIAAPSNGTPSTISTVSYHYNGIAVTGTPPVGTFDPSAVYANGDTTTAVWVEITDVQGCFSSDTAYVTVVHPPVINIDSAFNYVRSPYGTNGLDSSEHTYCRSGASFGVDGIPSYTTGTIAQNSIVGRGITFSNNAYDYDPGLVPNTLEADTVVFFYTDGLGCTNTDTAIIKLDSTPIVVLSGLTSTTVCTNTSPVQLVGSPAATATTQGFFRGPGVDTTGVFTPSLAGIGVHKLVYDYVGVTGCPNSDSLTVTVIARPPALFGGYAANFSYCSNAVDDTLYSNNDTINGSYQFFGDIVVSGTNIIRPSIAPNTANAKKIYYSYTSVNGCSILDSVSIVIYSAPIVSVGVIDSAYCANGAPASFQPLPNDGVIVSSDTAFTLGGIANSRITLDPTKTDTGYTTITYAFTDVIGCSDTASAQVYIQPVDIPSIIGLDPFYCQVSDTVPLIASIPGGYFIGSGIDSTVTGDWYFVPSRAQVGPNIIQYTIPGSFTAPGQQLICRAQTSDTVNVRPRLTPSLISPVDNSRFCSTDSLVRFVYDTLNSSTVHSFTDTSNAVVLIGYDRQDTIGVNRDTIVISSDTAFHLNPAGATQVANFINYVVSDTITGCKDSIRLTYVIDKHTPISYQLDSAYCESEDSIDMRINPRGGLLTRDGDTIVPSTPGAPYLFYTMRQDGITAPLTVSIKDTVTYTFINGACTSERTEIIDIHPVFPISFWTDSTHNTFCLGGDTVALITNDTGGVFSGTGVRTGTSFFIPDLAEAGIHPITFEFTDSVTGCYSKFVDTLYVYGVPTLDFEVAGGCQFDSINFIPNNSILNLNNLFQNNYVDSVTGVWWQVSDSVTLFDSTGRRDSISPIAYQYTNPGVYFTKLIVANQEFCVDTQTIRIVVSPKITNYPYTMDFEGTNGNWFAESRDSSYRLLWEWGIDSTSFGGPDNTSNHLWSTQNNATYEGGEQAWVYGPCFDLSSLNRPMISLDYWSDVRDSDDGGIIEYQKADGSWAPLGLVGRGINWFDAPFLIARPGDQAFNLSSNPIGWGISTNNWKNGRYKLDEVKANSNLVRLRIAFASVDIPIDVNIDDFYDGFAFDNVVIKNRDRNVLLETISNIGYQDMENANNHSYQLVHHTDLNKDVVMLQYHMESPNGNDMFYLHNETLGRNRAYEYSASPGRSLIDGGAAATAYITGDLEEADFEQDMLEDARFAISIDTFYHINGNFEVDATVIARDHMDSANYRIYVVISEDSLNYPTGSSYNSQLHAVARENDQFHNDPLRNTVNIFGQSWVPGQSRSVSFTWNHAADGFINYQPNHFHAVVFIQDIDTKEIFQVKTTRDISGYWVGIEPVQAAKELHELQSLNLFPNPAHDYFNLKFDQTLEHDYQWKLVNIQGVEVKQGTIQAGTDQVLVDGLDYPAGAYILLLYNEHVFVQRKVVLGRP